MKAITLTEPWASLVACGAKQVETRSWATDYRGPLAIHAAKRMTGADLDYAIFTREVAAALPVVQGYRERRPRVKDAFAETRGRVLAVTELVDCIPAHTVAFDPPELGPEFPTQEVRFLAHLGERRLGDFTPGRWAWLLGPVYRLANPVPATGALGLWEWEADEPTPGGHPADRVAFSWEDDRG